MSNSDINWGIVLDAAQWLFMVLLALVTWTRKPGEDASAAVNALSARLAVIEERVTHMPTSEELAELGGTVRALQSEVEGVREDQRAIKRQLGRIEDYLLNKNK